MPSLDTPPTLADTELTPDDFLLFSYTNLDPAGFRFMAILARDAAGDVHWLHPAKPQGDLPSMRPIKIDVVGQGIPQAVRPHFPAGDVWLMAVFSTRILDGEMLTAWVEEREVEERKEIASHSVVQIKHFKVRSGDRRAEGNQP